MPQLAPVMLLALTLRLLDAVKLLDVIFMLTGGGPGTSTYTTSFYLYQIGFPAIPSVHGDGWKLAFPHSALDCHHGARAPDPKTGVG